MTYEPGQQVLVRGTHEPGSARDDLPGVPVVFDEPNGLGDLLPIVVYVLAADVVGPAPATPDEGASYEPGQPISDDWRRSYERLTTGKLARLYELAMKERGEARAALAAAEARIAAALEIHNGDLCGVCMVGRFVDGPCDTYRALSVEAAGTEGGGGHE
jgi:hypothetical protein